MEREELRLIDKAHLLINGVDGTAADRIALCGACVVSRKDNMAAIVAVAILFSKIGFFLLRVQWLWIEFKSDPRILVFMVEKYVYFFCYILNFTIVFIYL